MFVQSGVFTLAAGWQVLQSSVLIQFSTMSDEPTTGCHADAVRILTGMLSILDSANPNDRAFKQVSIVFVFLTYFLPPKLYFPQPETHFVLPWYDAVQRL